MNVRLKAANYLLAQTMVGNEYAATKKERRYNEAMQRKDLSIRLMNRYSRGAEPIYRPMFFHGDAAGREIEQAEPIVGRKAMKEFLERDIHQTPTKASALLQKLDSEGSVEIP